MIVRFDIEVRVAYIRCPECGEQVSSKAYNCPHCGCPMPLFGGGKAKAKKHAVLAGVGCLGLIAVIAAAYLLVTRVL
ncbi:MAG: zinc ribbon domain-containing protein [Deltaproteobacteria bacterium]|nr:zinc ribbon domain-containing protein [Deltaproteobacteria bacterium]